MKEQETIEGNRLLAEFMGYQILNKEFEYKSFNSSNEFYYETDTGNIVCDGRGNEIVLYEGADPLFSLDELPFDSDWNWLMEVVEKINSLGYIFSIELHPEYERLKSKNYNRVEILHNEDKRIYRDSTISFDKPVIESVWQICIEFVKHYNNENNKEI